VVVLTKRKNLKIDPDTYDLLREHKGRFQTWDQFFWDAFDDEPDGTASNLSGDNIQGEGV